MIRGVIRPGDALRLDGRVCIWLGRRQVSYGNGPVNVDVELIESPASERVNFPGLTDHMQGISARATHNLDRYDGCDQCGAWTGRPCMKPGGLVVRHPHAERRKL